MKSITAWAGSTTHFRELPASVLGTDVSNTKNITGDQRSKQGARRGLGERSRPLRDPKSTGQTRRTSKKLAEHTTNTGTSATQGLSWSQVAFPNAFLQYPPIDLRAEDSAPSLWLLTWASHSPGEKNRLAFAL